MQIEEVLNAVKFARRLLSLQTPLSQRLSTSTRSSTSSSSLSVNTHFSAFISSAHSGATSLMAKAASLFAKFTPSYAAKVVDNLSEGRACSEDDSFCVLDPRSMEAPPERGSRYQEVIVFVLGGGSYAEYDNLQELLKQKQASGGALRGLAYGCSELLSGDAFFSQLVELGRPNQSSA